MKRLSVLRISYLKRGNETAKVIKVADVVDVNDDFYRSIFSKQVRVDGPVLARANNMVICKPTSTYSFIYFVYIICDETHPIYNLSLLLSKIFSDLSVIMNNPQWKKACDNYLIRPDSFLNTYIDSLVRSYTDIDKAIDRV